jgi:hypothetical protein
MPEVFPVTVHIKLPSRAIPTGQVAHGCFTFANGVVTLTDRDGNPVRDERGKLYERKLEEPHNKLADAEITAGFLTKEFRLALLGKTPSNERFSRPLDYPKKGFC